MTDNMDKLRALLKSEGEDHYKQGPPGAIEVAEYVESRQMLFYEGCIVKYISRHDKSETGCQDIKDIITYAKFILASRYGVLYGDDVGGPDIEPWEPKPWNVGTWEKGGGR